ncbi:TonB-dependent receptor [Novosphingobium flavum]|uniref:TonB-dependent receptor n=1 Tax=Novosphingobium flavum TaxID=1778672 RepID=A0A7X1KLE0_9SPHN|nr:TonB-dependent receptor [Novosphingobium flavum]
MVCLSAVAGALAVLSVPARAEEARPAAPAAEADGGGRGLDLVVTARRREESAETVPLAMTVVGTDSLTRTYTVNTAGLSQLVPTLNYSSPNPRNTSYTIRGLGSSVLAISSANDGLEPGVGYYVDQVYHARNATAAFDFADVDQVEVLRGPQGTLFGKNTTAGVIQVTTRAPEFVFGANAEVSAGNAGFLQAKASVTGPLVDDTLAFRLSGQDSKRGGVIYNTRLGRWQNGVETRTLRGQLLFRSGADFSFRLIGDWADFRGECCTQVYVRVAPTLKPAAQQYAALAAGQNYTVPSTNPYDRLTDIDARLNVATSEGGVSGIAEWHAGSATLTSVSAWRFWNWMVDNDRDYSGLAIQTTQRIPSRHDQFSQELRIASNGKQRLEYVGGLYFLTQKITGRPTSIYGPLATYWLLAPSATRTSALLDGYGSVGDTRFTAETIGVFGEVTWHLLPRLAATGGLRNTYESKDGSYLSVTSGGLAGTTALANDQQSILRAQSYTASVSDGSLSGRANLAWTLRDGVMAYVSYAKAAKSGGINMSGLPVDSTGAPVQGTAVVRPERNTTWEAGLKTQLLNKALTFNIDAYHVAVTDYQANVVDTVAPAALRAYLANIPKVVVKGVEIDAALALGTRFTLRAAGSWAHGRYADYPKGPCPIEQIGSGTASCNLTGKALSGLPEWSGSLGGQYAAPLPLAGHSGSLVLNADVSARTSTYADASASAYMIIAGYSVVNASIGWRGERVEIDLFARNLFNRNYMQNLTAQTGNSGLIVGTPGDPRIIGVTLRMHT